MPDCESESQHTVFTRDDFSTYYCPHCDEPFAKGILLHARIICPSCREWVVIAGLGIEEDK